MITISQSKIKSVTQTAQGESITQAAYNEIIQRLAFHKLSCTCGRHGDLVRHGYYNRSVKTALSSRAIRILRVRCKSCGKTHALLPESLVPYSSVTLKVHVEILRAFIAGQSTRPIMEANPIIDESTIGYITRQFKRHWLPRLASFKIPLDKNIVPACFRTFGRQFMQIKCTPNLLFS